MSDYQPAWLEYRRRRNQFLLAFAGFFPITFGVAVLSSKLFHTFTPAYVTAFCWMAIVLITGNRVERWPCPRCGKWFSSTWWYHAGFLARRCVHCGLPKYDQGISG